MDEVASWADLLNTEEALVDLSREIEVARAQEAVSYSVDTGRLPRDFDSLWMHLLRVLGASLRDFHAMSDADALCSLDLSQWWDRAKRPTLLLAIYITTDARVKRVELEALERALAGSGLPWSVDGVIRKPRTARPVLAISGGELFQVWLRRRQRTVAYGLSIADEVEWVRHQQADADLAEFLPEASHAIAHVAAPNPIEEQRAERLKLVFAHSVAMRIVEADGVVDDAELAFLAKRFPQQQLALFGIDGDVPPELLREAEEALPELLGHHEKLGLLSTFYSACYADGRLEVNELKVLREAAEKLGLGRDEVASYLQRLW